MLPRLSRGLSLPSGRTTTVAPTTADEQESTDEAREVPIPVPPDLSEEEVEEAAQAAEEALPEGTEAVVGESTDTQADTRASDDMQRTIDQLRASGDPNEVQRTPVLESGNIDVAPDEWELGFPLQGIPRLAAVLNLNYVYNEERERWERQEPFRDTAVGAPVAKLSDIEPNFVQSGSEVVVEFDSTAISRGMSTTPGFGEITVPADGVYHAKFQLFIERYEDRASVVVEVDRASQKLINTIHHPVLDDAGATEETVNGSGLLELAEGDTLKVTVTNFSGSLITVTGFDNQAYFSLHQI